MKSFYFKLAQVFTINFTLTFTILINAQTRYRDIVFPSVDVTKNIEFGSNTNIDGSTSTLKFY